MIRELEFQDIEKCAEILCDVYNNEVWQCKWSLALAREYLLDFYNSKKFVGYVLELDSEVCGAILSHEQIWWDNSELYIDELFILSSLQGKGYGRELVEIVETYVKNHNLAGITLTTNVHTLAPEFYKKIGFIENENIVHMYKTV